MGHNKAVLELLLLLACEPYVVSQSTAASSASCKREREREIYLHEKTAGNQKGKCPSTLVPILNQIINN